MAKAKQEKVFACPSYPELEIILKPSRKMVKDGVSTILQGEKIQFRAGRYITSDADEIKKLESYPNVHNITPLSTEEKIAIKKEKAMELAKEIKELEKSNDKSK